MSLSRRQVRLRREYLYRRSLPYVPPTGGQKTVGDDVVAWLNPPATLAEFLDLHNLSDLAPALGNRSLESLESFDQAGLQSLGIVHYRARRLHNRIQERPLGRTFFRNQLREFQDRGVLPGDSSDSESDSELESESESLRDCERIIVDHYRSRSIRDVVSWTERRQDAAVLGVAINHYRFKAPQWYHLPWRHRLHYTLHQRLDVYDAEFTAERVAWEKLNLLVKERNAAKKAIRLAELCADESREPTDPEDRDQRTLSRELEGLWKEDVEKELARRGMVLRVLPCVEIKQ